VRGSLVIYAVVHTLDNVSLTIIWPVVASSPECEPYPTTSGHINAVYDNKLTSECKLCLHPHRGMVSENLRYGVFSSWLQLEFTFYKLCFS
jgi:hypothetical protein